jgi:DNA modification methylase
MTGRILHGDCREQLATLPDNSIDAIVTDPPYELGFMGKRWDASGIAYDPIVWSECRRVLKPGGHLLAFGGTRTYHRMTVAIEDAGFEIRDSLHWLYGSGFPKSLDVSKAIDKQRYDRADVYRVTAWVREARDAAGITNRDIDDAFGFAGMAGHWTSAKSQPAVPTLDQVPTLLAVLGVKLNDVPDDIRQLLWDLNGRKGQPGDNWWKREVIGTRSDVATRIYDNGEGPTLPSTIPITAPATDAAHQWNGWGTALKPAHEPIVVARKPLTGTVAANVMEYGTGALNIDGTRVSGSSWGTRPPRTANAIYNAGAGTNHTASASADGGRWPANLVLTHSPECATECVPECPVAILDGQSGTLTSGSNPTRRGGDAARSVFGTFAGQTDAQQHRGADSGGASRFFTTTTWDPEIDAPFFYVPKPSRRERNAGLEDTNTHPTVKPVALMRHLVRLVTPPGGMVLDPFLGSGTTAVAATLEGFDWIGCELIADYLPIIEARVAWAETQTPDPVQPELFT